MKSSRWIACVLIAIIAITLYNPHWTQQLFPNNPVITQLQITTQPATASATNWTGTDTIANGGTSYSTTAYASTPVLSASTTTTSSTATTSTAGALVVQSQFAKGLLVSGDTILSGDAMPSLNQLVQGHFTIVGVNYGASFSASELTQLATWLHQVKTSGLSTFVMFGSLSYVQATTALPAILSIGADYVDVDEALGTMKWTPQQLHSLITTILQSSQAGVVVNEFTLSNLQTVYSMFGSNPRVFVAEDDYNNKATIDTNIQYAHQYAKPAISWAIFIPGYGTYDCLTNLPTWLSYLKPRSTGVWFFWVGPNGDWENDWTQVANF